MIRVENLQKKFGDFYALTGVNMHVPKGSVYGLVGPNGAGKTTLLNHIVGVYKQDGGSLTVDGAPVYENEKTKQKIASIADDWFFYNTFSLKEMATLFESLYPTFDRERYQKIVALLKLDETKQLRRLSKGMKKQAAFCIMLSVRPEVLVLDEPLDGLDPVMRKQILNLVINDVAEREMTVLVSSHNLRELEDICDRVGIIHKGEMIMEKALDDLKGNVHKYQLLAEDAVYQKLADREDVLHIQKTGSVTVLIAKGEAEDLDKEFQALSPALCERIGLTLEEIFIYELGGLDYDFKDILV